MDKEPKSIWGKIKAGFNEGRAKADRKFEAKHGYPPEEEIRRGWDRGKLNAREGRGPLCRSVFPVGWSSTSLPRSNSAPFVGPGLSSFLFYCAALGYASGSSSIRNPIRLRSGGPSLTVIMLKTICTICTGAMT